MQNKIKENTSGAFLVNSFPQTYDLAVLKYKNYKDGKIKLEDLTEEEQLEMKTLNVLENLGYPMDETGTYFYKDIIIRSMNQLQQIETEQDFIELMVTMANNYSQFYFDIARNEYDVGLTTFHSCIYMSNQYKQMNSNNKDLDQEIGLTGFTTDYKGEALLIANYIYKKENKKENPQVQKIMKKSNSEYV